MGGNYDNLSKLLSNLYNDDNIRNTYLIETNDIDYSLNTLKEFIFEMILHGGKEKEIEHANYLCISGDMNSNGSILLEQIHQARHFIYHTSMNDLPKIVVIVLPEYMTLNAANASLKFLEDDSILKYVFFISINIKLIPITITSRCIKLHHYIKENDLRNNVSYLNSELSFLLLRDCKKEKKIQFLATIDNIKSSNWVQFAYTIENILYRLWRSQLVSNYILNDTDKLIIQQFSNRDAQYIEAKYHKIMKLMQDGNAFNIHLHSLFFLILEEFYK